MSAPASDQYTGIVLDTIATSKELATKLQDDIAEAEGGVINLTTLEAQCLSSQLRITANLISGLLQEHNTIMVRVNELIDEGNRKKRGK